ncbi:MAG: DnaB-like helicase C-terminal domain-containing protein, partial [Cyanobacteria bacterium J06639_1]
QCQHLLLRFGILSTLKCQDGWTLTVNDSRSFKTFMAEVGISACASELNEIRKFLSNDEGEGDRIPAEIWHDIDRAKGNESWRSLAERANVTECSYGNALSREDFFKLALALDNLELQALATSDIFWDDIIAIAPAGVRQVYDLTIPETHNFIANDICVHNTAICINIAHNIAAESKFPVAIFSLEMSREQLVQRLLSSEARIEANRLRSGRISENEWQRLSQAIGHLAQLPIYIDDTPNCTVTEIRSKTRRLQAETGGSLGMVLLDYLQLMEGAGSENRVLELARITRGLKGLAKELNAPVVILSQLSRAVESRQDKHPQLSDLRESGCLVADTQLVDADTGKVWTIAQLANALEYPRLWSWNDLDRLVPQRPQRVFYSGHKPVYELTSQTRTIRATGNHPFLTRDRGWQALERLGEGEAIAAAESGELVWVEVDVIAPCGMADVFDITMPAHHNFVANDLVVHNSIEQDADLVLMLYRAEYYDPNTVDKGLAEVVIAKHRNGPTGIVKLLFENQYTQFRNLATPSG